MFQFVQKTGDGQGHGRRGLQVQLEYREERWRVCRMRLETKQRPALLQPHRTDPKGKLPQGELPSGATHGNGRWVFGLMWSFWLQSKEWMGGESRSRGRGHV